MLGTIAFYSSNGADATSFLEVTSGFGNADMLMNFSQTIKLLSKFRFISVYYGSLLEPFLSSGGEAIEPDSPLAKDFIVKNERNTRRKITLYK